MSKEMRKYIDTFKDRLLKENVSDAKFEEAFNRVKSYIDYGQWRIIKHKPTKQHKNKQIKRMLNHAQHRH